MADNGLNSTAAASFYVESATGIAAKSAAGINDKTNTAMAMADRHQSSRSGTGPHAIPGGDFDARGNINTDRCTAVSLAD
jgi:hypothetical protein